FRSIQLKINLFVKELPQFFEADCKGRGLIFTTKFFFKIISKNLLWSLLLFRRTIRLFEAGCKSRRFYITNQLLLNYYRLFLKNKLKQREICLYPTLPLLFASPQPGDEQRRFRGGKEENPRRQRGESGEKLPNSRAF
ncbi:MAG: hypothetical protein DI535_27625, partial [Citrobacter freundii]